MSLLHPREAAGGIVRADDQAWPRDQRRVGQQRQQQVFAQGLQTTVGEAIDGLGGRVFQCRACRVLVGPGRREVGVDADGRHQEVAPDAAAQRINGTAPWRGK